MRSPLAAVAASVALVAGVLPGTAAAQAPCGPGPHTATDQTIESHDGTVIAFTMMRPGAADCGPVPIIMHGHGWAGSRTTSLEGGLSYGLGIPEAMDNGYGIVSVDARGHGESGEQAHGMQPDLEIKDYSAVVDFLWEQEWVLREEGSGLAKDIVLGGAGGSYGGAWQILLSIFDNRIDAIVPQITWSNLANSFSLNGIPKTTWLSLLQAGGAASAEVDPRITQWYFEGLATGSAPAASTEYFRAAAMDSYPDRLTTPSMFVQGLPDGLFSMNEALSNYLMTTANGADAWLIGMQIGHVLPGVQPLGLGGPARSGFDKCATNLGHLYLDFYDTYLRGDALAQARLESFPRIAWGIENGTCATADAWPIESERVEVGLPGVAIPQGAGTLLLPLYSPTEDVTIAGIPTLSFDVPVPSTGNRVFASLVVGTPSEFRVLHDQITAYEVPLGVSGPVEFDLQGIASDVAAGEQLFLRFEGQSAEFFAGMQSRTGTAMAVTDLVLDLPLASRVVPAQDTTRPAAAPTPAPAPAPAPAPEPAPAPAPLPATGGGAALVALAVLGGGAMVGTRRR